MSSKTFVYDTVATPLRSVFSDCINGTQQSAQEITKKSALFAPLDRKSRKLKSEDTNERIDLLVGVLLLYRTEPQLAIWTAMEKDIPRVFDCIAQCLQEQNSLIKSLASDILIKLHQSAYIKRWAVSKTGSIHPFWSIS